MKWVVVVLTSFTKVVQQIYVIEAADENSAINQIPPSERGGYSLFATKIEDKPLLKPMRLFR